MKFIKINDFLVFSLFWIFMGVFNVQMIKYVLLDNYLNIQNYSFQFYSEGITLIVLVLSNFMLFNLFFSWYKYTQKGGNK